MAELFEKALQHVEEQKKKKAPLSVIQEKFPEFKDGDFVINRVYDVDPPMIGLLSQRNLLAFDEKTLEKLRKFVAGKGFLDVRSGQTIYLQKDGKNVGLLRENSFAATDQWVFEDLAREIYGIGGPPQPRILTFVETLLAEILAPDVKLMFGALALFALSPITLTAVTLLIAILPDLPQILVGNLGVTFSLAIVALSFLLSIYITAVYVREQIARAK